MNDYYHQHQLKTSASCSSLPAKLEIAVAPRRNVTRYTHKPLPPLPPQLIKSSHDVVQHNGSLNSDINSTTRMSTFQIARKGHNQRASIRKIQNLLGHSLDHVSRKSKTNRPVRRTNRVDAAAPQLPQVNGLSKLDDKGHMDTFSDIRRYIKSNSETSLASVSIYSQDNVVEEIMDTFSNWGSVALDLKSTTQSVKKSLYLQPAVYSASAAEVGQSSSTASVRHRIHTSIDGAQITPPATSLADLIEQERERFESYFPRSKTRFSHLETNVQDHDQTLASANQSGSSLWDANNDRGPNILPQPLALRQKSFDEHHHSMSRWSTHSSEDGGVLSNARDSVISHIRNISSPFKTTSRPSMVFKEKAEISTIQVPLPEMRTRKRAFSSGRHPLKSPFPLKSPLHKKTHSGHYSEAVEQPTLVRRMSDSFKQFSSSGKSPIVKYRIISNHARTGDGPDTPFPIKPGFKAMLSPTTVFFQKGTTQVQDAVRKAKSAAKAMSKEERRRDKLKKKIVVMGTTNPSSSVSR